MLRPLRRPHRLPDPRRAGCAAGRRALAADDFPPQRARAVRPPGRQWIGEMIDAVIDESLRGDEVRMDAADARGHERAARLHVRAGLPRAGAPASARDDARSSCCAA